VHSTTEPFTSHGKLRNYAEPKPFCRVEPTYVGFSSSIFTVQDHILSTAGDALTNPIATTTYVYPFWCTKTNYCIYFPKQPPKSSRLTLVLILGNHPIVTTIPIFLGQTQPLHTVTNSLNNLPNLHYQLWHDMHHSKCYN